MIKNKWVAFTVFVVLFLVLWNALRYFTGAFEEGYSVQNEIIFPAVIAALCGYVTYLKDDPFKRKEEQLKAEENQDASSDASDDQ